MKKLANLEGVKSLGRNEQKSINGGWGIYSCDGLVHPMCPVPCFMGQCLL